MKISACKYAGLFVAASLGGSGAALAEVPDLRIQSGGFDIRLTAGVGAQGALIDDNQPNNDNSDGEIDLFARLNAEWTSPGGILIGANVEQTNNDRETETLNTGEIYGFVATDFGRLEVGRQDGPADVLAFHAPQVGLGQVRGDFSRYAGSQALLSALDTRDAFKVIYLSPPISGLRGGISWSPEAKQNSDAINPRSRTIVKDAVELGLQFQQPFGNWIVGISGGYAFGNADPITTRADLNSWSIGAEAKRGPLRFGFAFVDRGDSNRLTRGFDQTEINTGISWVEDNWGVSFSAARTEASTQTNKLFGLGAFYSLTPNIQLRADIVNFREKRRGDPLDKGTVGLLEIQFSI
jgi:predicted porin